MTVDETPAAVQSNHTPSTTGHPVVVGFDGSQASRRALAYGVQMARNASESLVVAYVSSMNPGFDMGFVNPACDAGSEKSERDLAGWLHAEVSAAVDMSSIGVELIERTGDTARQLEQIATARTANAIVVGAPEHRRHHVAGSVPAWLARHACCPIVVVP
ncbi:universal stress protein [Antrihabitans cavernicola]|uniref:Universal stress protein n=1 Tax=Antrihabitans cavernicola TaxID=2495913 RepID=A0A5A7SBW7_9NOCA|nr:universal stress protein [Spelaeibacter cavernicola]KAA0022829.1 universal stress protein [Spelaeibacter cavernicola]